MTHWVNIYVNKKSEGGLGGKKDASLINALEIDRESSFIWRPLFFSSLPLSMPIPRPLSKLLTRCAACLVGFRSVRGF